ncbi:PH domain-containing protein [Candidatus Micrarchaeota archaeon]|nr:PH domain-containing protein [Candidatus Micrarchaeota archaeon]
MEYRYHPYPVVGAVKMFLLGLIFSAFILGASPILKALTLPVTALIWIIILLKIITIFIAARYKQVTLKDGSVTYRVGILSHHSTVLPYHKITEASYRQGLVQRGFGVGTLRLDTAGGSRMAIHIADIRKGDLKKTLDVINRKTELEVSSD